MAKIIWHGRRVQKEVRLIVVTRLKVAGELVRSAVVRNISRKSTRAVGPSKPGEFPHANEGTLRKNIFADVDSRALTARVGTPLKYGLFLEIGTSRMAPRPYLRPTLEESRAAIRRIFGGKGLRIV